MQLLTSSRAGSLPQGNAFQCGSEPARDGGIKTAANIQPESSLRGRTYYWSFRLAQRLQP
ncbi:hypothetical protein PspCFBP13508_25250 [Pseudomonas sp. CFBP13508]|nr:hypothetical protein PspCFBP13508_25250 [Pseudomonas sp. CFBP13508]